MASELTNNQMNSFRLISFCCLLPILLSSCGLYITTTKSDEITSENGHISAKGEWTYTKSKKMDMYDYYQKWEQSYTEYYDSGEIRSSYESAHKRSTYGRPCRELLSHYIEYWENGEKSYEQKDICDCSKSVTIHYDLKGNVLEKRIVRTKTKEIKKDKKKK